jgi:3-deoxy-7-phosphoheptulonate synthase
MSASPPPTPRLADVDARVPLDVPRGEEPWQFVPAQQQPDWHNPLRAATVRAELARLPGLVAWEEVQALRMLLAEVAAGKYQIVQAGDCAENPTECGPTQIARKVGLLNTLAEVMKANTGRPVVRIGRIAGQFAKPRSAATEIVDGIELPTYRGHLVNSPAPTLQARRADAERMLDCYDAAHRTTTYLRRHTGGWTSLTGAPVWTSHEALVLDYELPLLRSAPTGQTMLASTHLPWIGERTRQPDGAHVQILAEVANPVACKVGPSTTVQELVSLCDRLDPAREPGRLTLIARMGAHRVMDALPPLVAAVRAAGHPVAWVCDPMHGNTVRSPGGLKTRSVDTLIREVGGFQQAVLLEGAIPAGLHLETTPDRVTECAWTDTDFSSVGQRYSSLCDPRLNPQQAITVAGAWGAPASR